MYVRPPNNRNGVKIPENYSGNAFGRQSQFSDMPPPMRTQVPRHDVPRADLPPDEIRDDEPTYNEGAALETAAVEKDQSTEPSRAIGASLFSSLLPRGNLSSHFPFGHGIGSEELLILAVMLMVFLSGNDSGEVDSEFLLLLGLLLFAG
ncbi:MAG: hypothetical protein J6L83_06760 [Clostridia bacterium]|nr:hypothetical protein [Clostridia bacterium]